MNPAFSGWQSYALVEPPVLLFFFGQTVTGAVTTSLLVSRSRQYIMGIDDSELPPGNSSIEDTLPAVQAYVSELVMYKAFVDGLIPALLTFFLGPWSDSHGRKPLLVTAYAGSAMSFLLWSVLSSLGPLHPWIFLVASVPPALVGGYYSLILATYCYITDIRQESDRGWHLTWLQSVIPVGQVLGNLAGPQIWINFGYATVFGVASVADAIATIYVLFVVPETVIRRDVKRPWSSLFNPSLIKDMFATCVRKREGFDRVLIWCCVSALAINMLIGEGELGIGFLFAKARLGWDVPEYSLYLLAVVLLIITGTTLGGFICKALIDRTMSSMSITVLANASAFAGSIAKAFATQSWHFYLSAVLGILGGLSGPVIRNALSKSAPPQEVGKVFSLTTSMEAIIPLASAPLYPMVYSHYLPPVYPSPVYLVSAALYICTILIALTINWRISKLFKLKNPPITAVDPEVD